MLNNMKVYVPVKASFDAEGHVLPMEIVWEDGRQFQIDKVLDIRQAAAAQAGSGGDRYTVRIGGKERYLFFERNTIQGAVIGRWFVERNPDYKKLF